MASRDVVLVTGGSGYLAGWIIAKLLDEGYAVRATVRRLDRAEALRAKIARPGAPLDFVAADLTEDEGWAAAMDGVRYVIHTATPMMARGAALLAASRGGTARVLRSAAEAGVERVVLTSSGYAAHPPRGPRGLVQRPDEAVWTDTEAPALGDYARAKTLAERDAWAMAATYPALDFATVLPGFILGPLQSAEISPSMGLIAGMLKGAIPAVPNVGMSMVDVRDIADLHIRAMTSPAAVGQRFIGSAGFLWFRDVAQILRRELGPDAAARVPRRVMPDLVMRAAATFSPPLRELVPSLGRERHFDSGKAIRLLGWTPRPLSDSIVEGARSLLAHGVL